MRAWNDWHLEAWAGAYPDRIIPCQIPWLLDPEVGADDDPRERRARASRRSRSPRRPHKLGLPTLHTGYWDPIMQACAETGTVVNLHIGSSGASPTTTDDAPPDVTGVLFFGYAMFAAVDWLYSLIPVRFPDLKICLSEGGIGWVPACSTGSTTCRATTTMYGTWTDELTPGRGAAAQLLVLRRRGPVRRSTSATASASTTSCSRRTTRTATRRGPAPSRSSSRDRRAPGRRHPQDHVGERGALYRHPVPEAVQPDPEAF